MPRRTRRTQNRDTIPSPVPSVGAFSEKPGKPNDNQLIGMTRAQQLIKDSPGCALEVLDMVYKAHSDDVTKGALRATIRSFMRNARKRCRDVGLDVRIEGEVKDYEKDPKRAYDIACTYLRAL